MKFQFTHTAEIEVFPDQLIEVELTVTAEYTPFSRGSRGAHGEPEEPDELEEMLIVSCVDAKGVEWDVDNVPGIYDAAWSEFETVECE